MLAYFLLEGQLKTSNSSFIDDASERDDKFLDVHDTTAVPGDVVRPN
jgi:hypothetical protein